MPIINVNAFIRRVKRMQNGLMTPNEFLLAYIDRINNVFFHRDTHLYIHSRAKKLAKIFKNEAFYKVIDVKLPLLSLEDENILLGAVYEDTFWSYVNFDDKYDEATFDRCDKFLGEGLYGLVNDKVNVTVQPGDVVIDAGSWVGDFAAYASVKGATVYAFEPTESTFEILKKTAELNGNIIPVNKGLSDENTNMTFFENTGANTGSNSLMDKKGEQNFAEASSLVETIRLDDFVRENNLERVDFIKCDIEGFERHMLAGAQETLKRFSPKLALCTYHLPDDPEVMEALIKQANPKYNVVQKRKKLFASVPK